MPPLTLQEALISSLPWSAPLASIVLSLLLYAVWWRFCKPQKRSARVLWRFIKRGTPAADPIPLHQPAPQPGHAPEPIVWSKSDRLHCALAVIGTSKQLHQSINRKVEQQPHFERAWRKQWGAVHLHDDLVPKELRDKCKERLGPALERAYFPTLLREYLHHATVRSAAKEGEGEGVERIFVGLNLEGWLAFVLDLDPTLSLPGKTAATRRQACEARARRAFTAVNELHAKLVHDAAVTQLFHGAHITGACWGRVRKRASRGVKDVLTPHADATPTLPPACDAAPRDTAGATGVSTVPASGTTLLPPNCGSSHLAQAQRRRPRSLRAARRP